MKRFLILLSLLFCNVVFADTINLHWLNEDGSTYQNSTCVIDSDLILPSTPPTKYGYTFTGWKIENYTQIEYLESSGTQYINTGVLPNDTIGIEADVVWLKSGGDEEQIFGTRYNNDDTRFYAPSLYTGKAGYGWGDDWVLTNYTLNTATIYNVKFNYKNDRQVEINNNVIGALTSHLPENISGNTLPMFAGLYLQYRFLLTGRIYRARITNGSSLVRDFIPVLDKGGVPCMFDKVEGKFYYNQGTGQFIAGPSL